ncbi:hypothetical protein G6F50_017812 [Rhizopus delemar]|uniref:Uncharacterized protein n=1 Tax=Rhizopus delemar TaxID=936053 RepID=A0A9P7C0A1_9FUNG|nr:hypothetical protein G6F50_017812 [Rhizopus delemar]
MGALCAGLVPMVADATRDGSQAAWRDARTAERGCRTAHAGVSGQGQCRYRSARPPFDQARTALRCRVGRAEFDSTRPWRAQGSGRVTAASVQA